MSSDTVGRAVSEWRAERPDLNTAPMQSVGRILQLAQIMDAILRPPFREAGLGNGEFDILATLRRAGSPYERTPRELARAMMVTSGGITKQIDRLVRKGLVMRGADPNDARSRTISLTASGIRIVDDLMPEHLANQASLLSALSATQRTQLGELLGAIADDLEAR